MWSAGLSNEAASYRHPDRPSQQGCLMPCPPAVGLPTVLHPGQRGCLSPSPAVGTREGRKLWPSFAVLEEQSRGPWVTSVGERSCSPSPAVALKPPRQAR